MWVRPTMKRNILFVIEARTDSFVILRAVMRTRIASRCSMCMRQSLPRQGSALFPIAQKSRSRYNEKKKKGEDPCDHRRTH